MQVDVHIVSAFTDDGAGGNQAGVVIGADGLSAEQKLKIAAAVGLSETAFVSSSRTAAYKLEFFTPTRQIAHCGHATIATFCLLRQLGRVAQGLTSKETIDGNRDIIIDGEAAFMEQRAPRYVPLAKEQRIAAIASLRIQDSQLADGLSPTLVNTGNSFLIIPVARQADLRAIKPDQGAVERLSEELDLIGYYAYALETKVPGRDAGARMFAPRYGIPEEPATGMAAGPLACFLRDKAGLAKTELLIEQGHLMEPPSPSVITVKLDLRDGGISRLLAGGRARSVRQLSVTA